MKNYILYKVTFPNNKVYIGITSLGYKHLEKSKEKMRKPRPNTSKSLKGKKKSLSHRLNLSKSRKNFRYSYEQREQHSVNCGGRKFEVLKKNSIIGYWSSKKLCAEKLGIHPRGIQGCLNQPYKFKSYKGYTFRYVGENNGSI